MKVNTFDIDGVIYLGEEFTGIYPGPNDLIITGRSFEEQDATVRMLQSRGIKNHVFYNRIPFDDKTRISSANHKIKTIQFIQNILSYTHGIHFEDDPVQIRIIQSAGIRVVGINSAGYVDLENVRHEITK